MRDEFAVDEGEDATGGAFHLQLVALLAVRGGPVLPAVGGREGAGGRRRSWSGA